MHGFPEFFGGTRSDMMASTPSPNDRYVQHTSRMLQCSVCHMSAASFDFGITDQFTQIAVKIQDLEPGLAFHSMIATLKPKAIVGSLCKKWPTRMDELGRRAIGSIQMEELFEYHDKVKGWDQKKPDSNKEKLTPVKEIDFKRQPRQLKLWLSMHTGRSIQRKNTCIPPTNRLPQSSRPHQTM